MFETLKILKYYPRGPAGRGPIQHPRPARGRGPIMLCYLSVSWCYKHNTITSGIYRIRTELYKTWSLVILTSAKSFLVLFCSI